MKFSVKKSLIRLTEINFCAVLLMFYHAFSFLKTDFRGIACALLRRYATMPAV